jgi:hypothetical protein
VGVSKVRDTGIGQKGTLAETMTRQEWLSKAREGLAFEAEALRRDGPSLARYRRPFGRCDLAAGPMFPSCDE